MVQYAEIKEKSNIQKHPVPPESDGLFAQRKQQDDSASLQRIPVHYNTGKPAQLLSNNTNSVIQRLVMPITEFMTTYPRLYAKHYNQSNDRIWRFTSHPDEKIGRVERSGDVIDQATGTQEAKMLSKTTGKPLSFAHNLNSFLATAMSKHADENILTYIDNSDYLCSIDISAFPEMERNGYIVWVAAVGDLHFWETECVLGRGSKCKISIEKNSLTELVSIGAPGIHIEPNPFKGKVAAKDFESLRESHGIDIAKIGEQTTGLNKEQRLSRMRFNDVPLFEAREASIRAAEAPSSSSTPSTPPTPPAPVE